MTPPGRGVRYDADLVEAAVLRAVDSLAPAERKEFRHRRDALYGIGSDDDRDAAFEALHGEWFLRLGLDRPLHAALAERPEVAALGECRVLRAPSRREEMADLVGAGPGDARRLLVVRLRPESLLDAGALGAFLRREILHVADMLDPGFGYQRELPASEEGPSYDNVLRDRYRAVWTTSVAGRLARAGRGDPAAVEQARRDFSRAFAPLGERIAAAFEAWLSEPRPTHSAIVGFILDPRGDGRDAGRCPLCRFPGRLVADASLLASDLLAAVREEHPGWSADAGLCPQCRDLYAAL